MRSLPTRLAVSSTFIALLFQTWVSAAYYTRQHGRPGQIVQVSAEFPPGVAQLINDPLRTYGWSVVALANSYGYNDAEFYEMDVRTTADLKHLIDCFAAIKASVLRIELDSGTEPGNQVMPPPNRSGSAAEFFIGRQSTCDRWFESLPQVPGAVSVAGAPIPRYTVDNSIFLRPPTAIPPTLRLYLNRGMIDLKLLDIPLNVEVSLPRPPGPIDILPTWPPAAGKPPAPVDPNANPIQGFIDAHKAKQERARRAAGGPATQPD